MFTRAVFICNLSFVLRDCYIFQIVQRATVTEKGPRLPALCKLPAAPGLCLAYFPRWFFNSKTGKCEKFIYGGCGGNKNNFLTKEDCEKTCWCPPPCRCYCEFGFQTDEYGCKICKCIDPCKVTIAFLMFTSFFYRPPVIDRDPC